MPSPEQPAGAAPLHAVLAANEALARALDVVALEYLLARYGGPGNPMGTQVLHAGATVATKVPFAPANPLMNTARGIATPDELAEVLAFHRGDRDAAGEASSRPCWVETAPYTPTAVTDALVLNGFRLERQAATLYASPLPAVGASGIATPGVAVHAVNAANLAQFLDTLNRGFGVPAAAVAGMRANQSFWCDVPTWRLFLATIDGEPAGAAVLSVHEHAIHGRIGYLAAASTLTDLRGRGVQGALIAERIERARVLGCTLLTGQAAWGSTSQANMQRAGMQLCHLRTVWKGSVQA